MTGMCLVYVHVVLCECVCGWMCGCACVGVGVSVGVCSGLPHIENSLILVFQDRATSVHRIKQALVNQSMLFQGTTMSA